VKPFSEVKALGLIYPSLDYRDFNCSEAECDIIESHTWGEPTYCSKFVNQVCSECGSHIGARGAFGWFYCSLCMFTPGTICKIRSFAL